MKAIVTGGAGFIGSHLTDRLIKMGWRVLIIDDLSSGYEDNINDKAYFAEMDICDVTPDFLIKAGFYDADVLFNQAASKKNVCLHDPHRDLEVNGGGTLNLLYCAKTLGMRKFVHASTGSVYGEQKSVNEDSLTLPVSYYGVSKLAGESYVRMYGVDYTVLSVDIQITHTAG